MALTGLTMINKAYLATEWYSTQGPTKLGTASVKGKDLRKLLQFFPTAKTTISSLWNCKYKRLRKINGSNVSESALILLVFPILYQANKLAAIPAISKKENKKIKMEEPETGDNLKLSSVPSSLEELSDEE